MTEIQVFSIVTLVAVIVVVIHQIILRIRLLNDQIKLEENNDSSIDQNYSHYPCGNSAPHREDFTNKLDEILNVGMVYETIASQQCVRCRKEEGNFWLAWIRSYRSEKCCGLDELVGFDTMPPKHFILALNGKIIEVVPNDNKK